MAAARKKEIDLDVEQDVTKQPVARAESHIFPTTVSRTSPFRSPARDMQESLAHRLQQAPKSRTEVAAGLIVGILGATWVTGMLIYATL